MDRTSAHHTLVNPTALNIAAALWFASAVFARSEDTPHPKPVISIEMPREVDAPVDPDLNEVAAFDDYSWRAFVALNWPAKPGFRGVPDETKRVGDPSDAGSRVVWETWKADYETVGPDGTVPTEWLSFDGLTPSSALPFDGSGHTILLGSFSGFSEFNQAGFGRFGGPLVAQNHTYVRFEVRLNEAEFDFIRSQQLYRRESSPAGGNERIRFPANSAAVKAAWKIIKPDELAAAQGRYYIVDAVAFDPVTNAYTMQKVGLVGLHIVQKTATRPQWVWSSFEHIDNVPEPGVAPAPGRHYSFNDPAKPQALWPAVAPPPISKANVPLENPRPMQVIRMIKIADSTRRTNDDYHAVLKGTVWENYELVMTQWPKFPEPEEENGAPFPGEFTGPNPMTDIANTTMETYYQKSASTSCMACHDVARRRGSDFVWFLQLHASGR